MNKVSKTHPVLIHKAVDGTGLVSVIMAINYGIWDDLQNLWDWWGLTGQTTATKYKQEWQIFDLVLSTGASDLFNRKLNLPAEQQPCPYVVAAMIDMGLETRPSFPGGPRDTQLGLLSTHATLRGVIREDTLKQLSKLGKGVVQEIPDDETKFSDWQYLFIPSPLMNSVITRGIAIVTKVFLQGTYPDDHRTDNKIRK
jgi:hypothetical protein